MIGLPKSPSFMPVARQRARAPAMLRPWVEVRERYWGMAELRRTVTAPPGRRVRSGDYNRELEILAETKGKPFDHAHPPLSSIRSPSPSGLSPSTGTD